MMCQLKQHTRQKSPVTTNLWQHM